MLTMKKVIYTLSAITVLMLGYGCKQLSQNIPDDAFITEEAMRTPEDLQALLNSCYDALANQLNGNVQISNDLLSDDLAAPLVDGAGFKNEIYNRNTNIFNSDVGTMYRNLYLIAFRVNNMAEYYDKVGVSPTEKTRMEGEAKFLRALCHFEVAKLWAHPPGFEFGNTHPGVIIRDQVSQRPKPRANVAEVYNFIIADLQFAAANLPPTNPVGKAYANQYAAKGLLAKVYYMLNRPTEAIALLNEVIPAYNLSDSLNRFDNSPNSIAEHIFGTVSLNSGDNRAGEFIGKYRSDTKQPDFVISKELYTLLTSDTLDKRGKQLVKVVNEGKDNEFYAVTKFNRDFFAVPYLTLTDMLLTRAELLAETNTNLPQAIADVNAIINRAYSDPTQRVLSNGAGQSVVLAQVRLQRRLELFCEGDRVQSLKRRGAQFDASLRIRNAPWNCPGIILQFPALEDGEGFVFNGTGGCN